MRRLWVSEVEGECVCVAEVVIVEQVRGRGARSHVGVGSWAVTAGRPLLEVHCGCSPGPGRTIKPTALNSILS